MSYMVYIYQKTPPKNLEYAHQWTERSLGRIKVYTHTLFGDVDNIEQIKKAINVNKCGIFKLKNLKIDIESMPVCFQKHLNFLEDDKNKWTKRKKEIADNADFSDLLISI